MILPIVILIQNPRRKKTIQMFPRNHHLFSINFWPNISGDDKRWLWWGWISPNLFCLDAKRSEAAGDVAYLCARARGSYVQSVFLSKINQKKDQKKKPLEENIERLKWRQENGKDVFHTQWHHTRAQLLFFERWQLLLNTL